MNSNTINWFVGFFRQKSKKNTYFDAKYQDGFTMIELLVSLTIVGLTITLLVSGLQLVSKNWDRTEKKISRQEEISRAINLFYRDIKRFRPVFLKKNNTYEYFFNGDTKELSFIVVEPAYPTLAGPYVINYTTNNSKAGLRRERHPFKEGITRFEGATPANQVVLLENSLTYIFSYGEVNSDTISWTSNWTEKNRLPDMIKMHIKDGQTNKIISPPIIAKLPIDAEQTCISSRARICSPKSNDILLSIKPVKKIAPTEEKGRGESLRRTQDR